MTEEEKTEHEKRFKVSDLFPEFLCHHVSLLGNTEKTLTR